MYILLYIILVINKRSREEPQCGRVKWDLKLYPGSSKANFIEESTCLFLDKKKNFESIVPSLPFLVNSNMAI